jgi:uncharacterized protein (UPF0264 family)
MELLVSVATADDARAALAGGADIVDAKEPTRGALGAVTMARFAEIRQVVGRQRPLTAAIGDAMSEAEAEHLAWSFAAAGASLVKLACVAHLPDVARGLLRAAVAGAGRAGGGVVAVAYADVDLGAAVTMDTVVELAAMAGASGVLVDTADKQGRDLLALVGADGVRAFVSGAHRAGLRAAVAGRLCADHLPTLAACGADIAGVRGSVCDAGREGRVVPARVADLHARLAHQLVT